MQRVVLAGEGAGQVRITLPVAGGIAIGETREIEPAASRVSGRAAMGKRVAERVADRLGGGRISGEVAAAGGIAPRALRIPMPGLGVELCVLAVGDGLPAGIEEHLKHRAGQLLIGDAETEAVHPRAHRAHGAKGIGSVRGSGIDDQVLRQDGPGAEQN